MLVAVEDEGDAEEEEEEGDEADQGQLLLQVGQPGRRQVLNLIKQESLFSALDDDGHGEAGHDEPLDIEHLEKKCHRIVRRMRRYRHHLDQQPGVVVLLLLHLGAALWWAGARHS